jgi:transcriptional regulator with XRE-family HTH domain
LLTAEGAQLSHLNGVNIGDRIRAARQRAGITQRALAELLGVDKSAVAQWEGGGGGTGIKTSNLVELARVLGIKPSELLGAPSPDDQLLLESEDEIALVTLYRRLSKELQDIHLRMMATQVTEGQPAERPRRPTNRRLLSA